MNKIKSHRYYGHIPGCIHLGAADLGHCEMENGEKFLTSWGRNFTKAQAQWFTHSTGILTICIGEVFLNNETRDNYEVIIDKELYQQMKPFIIKRKL